MKNGRKHTRVKHRIHNNGNKLSTLQFRKIYKKSLREVTDRPAITIGALAAVTAISGLIFAYKFRR